MKTYLIDTNYILRFLIKDIKSQYKTAKKLLKEIEKEKAVGIVSLLVVNELIWIMENFYELDRENFISPILKLLSLKKIKIKEMKKEELSLILKKFQKTNFDFTDLYLNFINKQNKKNLLKTFDKSLENI